MSILKHEMLYVWHSKHGGLFSKRKKEDCIKITLFHRLPLPILISGGDSQFEVSCLPNDERVSYAGPAINKSSFLHSRYGDLKPNPNCWCQNGSQ